MSALIGVGDRVGVGNIAIPERAGFAATSRPEIDAAVAAVSSRRVEWQRVSGLAWPGESSCLTA
jgi:hypothetical protein